VLARPHPDCHSTVALQEHRPSQRRAAGKGGRAVDVACGQAGQGGAPLPRVPRAPRDGCEGRGQILRRRGVAGAWRPGQPRSSRGEPPDPTKGRSVCLPSQTTETPLAPELEAIAAAAADRVRAQAGRAVSMATFCG